MDEFIPTFHFVEIAQSDDRSALAATRENTTRTAVVQMTYTSTGIGQHRVHSPVLFPVVFREEPHFTNGSTVVSNGDLGTWHDPIGNAGVYGWQVDDAGHYTGAFLWLRVDVYAMDEDNRPYVPPKMVVQHHLSFTGTAIKDLTKYVNTKNLTSPNPRTVGI